MKTPTLIEICAFVLLRAGVSRSQGQRQICSRPEGGSLSVWPPSSLIEVVPSRSSYDEETVFLHTTEELVFHCSLPIDDGETQITFTPKLANVEASSGTSSGVFTSSRSLKSSNLKFSNSVNSEKLNVACQKVNKSSETRIVSEICKVNIIEVNEIPVNCSGRQNLTCAARDILKELKDSPYELRASGPDLTEHYVYSVYSPEVQDWIFCKQLDKSGYSMKNATYLYNDTETIVCPINNAADAIQGPIL